MNVPNTHADTLTPVTVKRLESGYVHLRGRGPCNWAQPPYWPCDEETLRAHAFSEASEGFIQSCIRAALATDSGGSS